MINNVHSDYTKHEKAWVRASDCYAGEEVIKSKTTQYLPKLGHHYDPKTGDQEYEVYLNYAKFFGATYRTVTALTGLVCRKDIYVEGKNTEKYIHDFTIDNRSITTAAESAVNETLLKYRMGILVSYPDIDTSNMTKQEFIDKGIHAYAALYKTEDIINWKLEKVNGRMVPTLIVLKEAIADPFPTDKFDTDTITQYSVLELENGVYKHSVYLDDLAYQTTELTRTTYGYLYKEIYPEINGKTLDYIPFFPITPKGISWDIEDSPMAPIVDLNIGHYRNSATYEQALVKTASPTTVLRGFQGDRDKKIILGGSQAILVSADGGADYLEYQGTGISEIRQAMDIKQKQMAVLGAGILSNEKTSNVSAESESIQQSGEQAVLASIAKSASDAFTQALRLMVSWDDYEGDLSEEDLAKISVRLNTDFSPNSLTANDINALIVAWQKMALSDKELFEIFKKGEIIPAEMTFDEHITQVESSAMFQLVNSVEQGANNPLREKAIQASTTTAGTERLSNPNDPNNPNSKDNIITNEE